MLDDLHPFKNRASCWYPKSGSSVELGSLSYDSLDIEHDFTKITLRRAELGNSTWVNEKGLLQEVYAVSIQAALRKSPRVPQHSPHSPGAQRAGHKVSSPQRIQGENVHQASHIRPYLLWNCNIVSDESLTASNGNYGVCVCVGICIFTCV